MIKMANANDILSGVTNVMYAGEGEAGGEFSCLPFFPLKITVN